MIFSRRRMTLRSGRSLVEERQSPGETQRIFNRGPATRRGAGECNCNTRSKLRYAQL